MYMRPMPLLLQVWLQRFNLKFSAGRVIWQCIVFENAANFRFGAGSGKHFHLFQRHEHLQKQLPEWCITVDFLRAVTLVHQVGVMRRRIV